jgi:hypothetical protein
VPDPAVLERLTSGSSSGVVGLCTAEGEPFATRCWGVRAVGEDPLQLRLLLPAGSLARVGLHAGDGHRFPLALTSAHVVTLHAVQAKGTAHSLEAATADDHALFEEYKAAFFETVNRSDGYPPDLLVRWAPMDLCAATLDVDALFDQTPGPGAGSPLPVGSR